MQLFFDTSKAATYKKSQLIRVLSETWAAQNLYCPHCGNHPLKQFAANKEVADFYCEACHEEYELKSQNSKTITKKITAGAYEAMLRRISANNKPNFFFLTYDKTSYKVTNLIIIPKHFFISEIIEKRPKLSATARRAGWIGCNILLSAIPSEGRITIIHNAKESSTTTVLEDWGKTLFLRKEHQEKKGWLIDIMLCIETLGKQDFTVIDLYSFEHELQSKHPNNRYIKAKIRQQLQKLRDKQYLTFTTKGTYHVT